VQGGRIEIGGDLPCNTSGGMLSESYMQSWNHQPELARQLRGGLRHRQVQDAEVAQYVHDVAGKCKSLIYTWGA
jgi:thiolase-like protein